jgi:hypothetical protein
MDWVRLAVTLGVYDTMGVMLALAPTRIEGVVVLSNDGLKVGDRRL